MSFFVNIPIHNQYVLITFQVFLFLRTWQFYLSVYDEVICLYQHDLAPSWIEPKAGTILLFLTCYFLYTYEDGMIRNLVCILMDDASVIFL